VLIAVTATLVGFAFEAGSGREELGAAFAVSYTAGCVIAAVAVRASGLFTAVIQPPLLLFVAVPLSYFLLHRSSFAGLKDLLITCGYPLVERFPLMLFTSAAVLLVGMIRWYAATGTEQTGAAEETGAAEDAGADPVAGAPGHGVLAGMFGRLSAFIRSARGSRAESTAPGRPRHGIDRSARAAAPGRDGRRRREHPDRNGAPRPRHARPARAEDGGPSPRRRGGRRSGREADFAEGPPQRSRPRHSHRPRPYEPPPERNGRRAEWRDDYYPPPREPRYEPRREPGVGRRPDYAREPRPPYPPRNQPPYPPRHRPRPEPPMAAPRGDGSHHPVSRVRYRGEPPDPADRPEPRRQPGRPRRDAGR